MNKTAASAA